MKTIVKSLVNSLGEIEKGAYLSAILDRDLKNIDPKSKALYTKLLYGVVERKLYLDYQLEPAIKGRVKLPIRNILRIGEYAHLYLSMPDGYIVDNLVSATKSISAYSTGFVNAVLRKAFEAPLRELPFDYITKMSIKLSLDKDLVTLLYNQYGEKIESFYQEKQELNTYRINQKKLNLEEASVLFKDYKVKDNFVYSKESLVNSSYFKDGLIIAQDVSSAKVVDFLPKYDFKQVLDACSAPGGKTLYLREKLSDASEIDACDVYPKKLEKLNDNIKRLGLKGINTYLADATSFDYLKKYDLVIVDAPCSGLGVLNHKPDLKYNMDLSKIKEIIKLQERILDHLAGFVSDGGLLLYSTCTINGCENEEMARKFLSKQNNFVLEKEQLILPNSSQDGFYMVLFRRIN